MSIFSEVGSDSLGPKVDTRLIKLIGERFIARKDVKAIERSDGAWNPVTDTGKSDGKRLPFSVKDFQDHFAGKRTLGHYLVAPDNTCKLFAFDIDLDKDGWWIDTTSTSDDGDLASLLKDGIKCNPRSVWAAQDPPEAVAYFTTTLRGLADGLAAATHRLFGGDVHVAIANSGGKGLHVYGFTGSMPAADVREYARAVLMEFGGIFEPQRGDNFWKHTAQGAYRNLTIEIFPKQDNLDGKDLGNLMRLPLGVNRKTGRRGHFITSNASYARLIEMDPMRALTGDLPWE